VFSVFRPFVDKTPRLLWIKAANLDTRRRYVELPGALPCCVSATFVLLEGSKTHPDDHSAEFARCFIT
jgi:hypothetical protein